MKDCIVKIATPTDAIWERIQHSLLDLGYKWPGGEKYLNYEGRIFIYVWDNGTLTTGNYIGEDNYPTVREVVISASKQISKLIDKPISLDDTRKNIKFGCKVIPIELIKELIKEVEIKE